MGALGLVVAIVVVVVFQLLSARMVRRAQSAVGDTRAALPLMALVVPVAGPMIAGRAADAGLRPALVSTFGLALGLGAHIFLNTAPTPPGEPQGGNAVADAAKNPAPDKAPAPTPEKSAAAAPTKTPAEAPQATPAAPKPAAPAAPATVAAPKPATPKPATAEAPDKKAAAPPRPKSSGLIRTEGELGPAPVVAGMAAQDRATVSLGRDAVFETRLTSGPQAGGWCNFAAAFMTPPGSPSAVRHFYAGGFVRSYHLNTVDRFHATPIDDSDLKPGREFTIGTQRGTYSAMVRVDRVSRDDQGTVQSVDLLVTIK